MKTVTEIRQALSSPRPQLIADMHRLSGDIIILGAAGKLGPSLTELAVRALAEAGTQSRVYAVSRFSDPTTAEQLRTIGATVVNADISDDTALAGLPDAENVVFLVGAKFGSADNQAATWATNTYLPATVAKRFPRSRICALSTGNVYPMMPPGSGGADERCEPGPIGDYAMSCLGRERLLAHFCRSNSTPLALIRLNYAVETRYGVLVDIAQQILVDQPVDLTTGSVNVVWQGYANEVILRSLLHADVPEFVLNLTGPETLSTRTLARLLADALGRDVSFTGVEAPTALLSDASACHHLFGYPDRGPRQLIDDVAQWLRHGGHVLNKPTKFAVRDGRF